MATGGFCGARARRREREAGTDGSSSGAHAGYTCGAWTVCEGGGVDLHARDSEPIVRGWHTRPWSWPMASHAHGFAGSRMGGVGGRLEPCEGRRWLRCGLKRYGQFCCGTRSRSHTRGQRAVHAWWWGGGIDVVHERASESVGIFVVLRRHTCSQRHTCGHRETHVVHARGALGAIHVAAHTHGDARDAREVAASRERPMCRKI